MDQEKAQAPSRLPRDTGQQPGRNTTCGNAEVQHAVVAARAARAATAGEVSDKGVVAGGALVQGAWTEDKDWAEEGVWDEVGTQEEEGGRKKKKKKKGREATKQGRKEAAMARAAQAEGGGRAAAAEGTDEGSFDRIICDVPCSGDGTTRKNPSVWHRWSVEYALTMHPLQLQIALRGVSLLKVGGLMAYSTCSLNPCENESVVAELLRRTRGSIELVDASDRLPALNRAEGLHTWVVLDDDMQFYESYDALRSSSLPVALKRKFLPSMWPPRAKSVEDALPLHRCLRLLPHLADMGGFFVALLRKVRECRRRHARSTAPHFTPLSPERGVCQPPPGRRSDCLHGHRPTCTRALITPCLSPVPGLRLPRLRRCPGRCLNVLVCPPS